MNEKATKQRRKSGRPDPTAEMLKLLRHLSRPIMMQTYRGEVVPLPISGDVVYFADFMRAYDKPQPMDRSIWLSLTGDPHDDGRPMTISDLYASTTPYAHTGDAYIPHGAEIKPR